MKNNIENHLQFYTLIIIIGGAILLLTMTADIYLIEVKPTSRTYYFFDTFINLIIGCLLIILTVFSILEHLSIAKRFMWLFLWLYMFSVYITVFIAFIKDTLHNIPETEFCHYFLWQSNGAIIYYLGAFLHGAIYKHQIIPPKNAD